MRGFHSITRASSQHPPGDPYGQSSMAKVNGRTWRLSHLCLFPTHPTVGQEPYVQPITFCPVSGVAPFPLPERLFLLLTGPG